MAKLLRVSNISRGKKLIVCTAGYSEFIDTGNEFYCYYIAYFFKLLFNWFIIYLLVRAKFNLDLESEIHVEDEQGAAIEEEAFPVLLEQSVIPNIIFKIKGESNCQVEVENNSAPNQPHYNYGNYYISFFINL